MTNKELVEISKQEIKKELDKIREKIEIPIEENSEKGNMMHFDCREEIITYDLQKLSERINEILKNDMLGDFSNTTWKDYLVKMVDHEKIHKEQNDYFKDRYVSPKQLEAPHFQALMEFQALNQDPDPVRKQVWRRKALDVSENYLAKLIHERKIDNLAKFAHTFTREEIRKKIEDPEFVDFMIEFKNLGENILNKNDILRNQQNIMEVLP